MKWEMAHTKKKINNTKNKRKGNFQKRKEKRKSWKKELTQRKREKENKNIKIKKRKLKEIVTHTYVTRPRNLTSKTLQTPQYISINTSGTSINSHTINFPPKKERKKRNNPFIIE